MVRKLKFDTSVEPLKPKIYFQLVIWIRKVKWLRVWLASQVISFLGRIYLIVLFSSNIPEKLPDQLPDLESLFKELLTEAPPIGKPFPLIKGPKKTDKVNLGVDKVLFTNGRF